MSALRLLITEQAQSEAIQTQAWLAEFSPDAAERFASVLRETLERLCEEAADDPVNWFGDLTDRNGAPFHRHLMVTAKRRARRGNSGVWWLLFLLTDEDRDGKTDTLRLVGIIHAASQRGTFS